MPHFSLLSLNCFGVPTGTTRQRLHMLAQELNRRDCDVVALQEVQAHTYRRLLIEACTSYPAHAFEPFIHAPKGGLLTLARPAIEHSRFTLYTGREFPYTPAMMDWALHKGVLEAQLTIAQQPVVVLNTHLNANYSGDWSPENRYAHVEQEQLRELSAIVARQPPDALVVAVGDFNLPRGSRLYDEFLASSQMVDPLAGDLRATYRTPRGVPARYALPIDFVFVRAPALPGLQLHADLCFGEQVQLSSHWKGYLSDHLGLTFRAVWDDLTR